MGRVAAERLFHGFAEDSTKFSLNFVKFKDLEKYRMHNLSKLFEDNTHNKVGKDEQEIGNVVFFAANVEKMLPAYFLEVLFPRFILCHVEKIRTPCQSFNTWSFVSKDVRTKLINFKQAAIIWQNHWWNQNDCWCSKY